MRDHEEFCGEFEVMDLSKLKDKVFLCAVATGQANHGQYLPSTIRGPFNFWEMAQFVGVLWRDKTVHAMVMIPSADLDVPNELLDACTIDYIEAHFMDVLMEGMLGGSDMKEYTCSAETFWMAKDGRIIESSDKAAGEA